MEQNKLRAYFGYFPMWTMLLIVLGLCLGLMTFQAAPGGNFRDNFRSRMHAVFADELGLPKNCLEGYMRFGIFLCLGPLPLLLIGIGGAGLWKFRQEQVKEDAEADALLEQRLAVLPAELESRLGLPARSETDALLILWSPRPEDLGPFHLMDRKARKNLKPVPEKLAIGKDGLIRCARLDVLVLERRGQSLYILDGFYDLIKGQVSGEHWGEYRLADVAAVKEDADYGRIALVMADGAQYAINLLMDKEAEQVFRLSAFPLVLFTEAGQRLRSFCVLEL